MVGKAAFFLLGLPTDEGDSRSFSSHMVSDRRHAREVYPPATFERKRQFGVPVHVSRHPGVRAMITDTLEAARDAIRSGAAEEVHLVILDRDGSVMEQFAFAVDVALDPAVPVTSAEAAALFGAGLVKLGLLETVAPAPSSDIPADSFTLALACVRKADAELSAAATRVARLAASEGRAPGLAADGPHAGTSSSSFSSFVASDSSLWIPLAPHDPEASLIGAKSGSPGPQKRAIKQIEAGKIRLSVSWIAPP